MQTQDIVETWRQEAVQEGRQEGRQRLQEVLLHLVRQRFGSEEVDDQVEQRVATASIEQIETWTGRVLSAATLSELLAD
jgi:hypothetical protein